MITIHDGVSYVGLIPLAATNLGRDTEIEIADDGEMTPMQGGGQNARGASHQRLSL